MPQNLDSGHNPRAAAARYAIYGGVLAAVLCALLIGWGSTVPSTGGERALFLAIGAIGLVITIVGVAVGLAVAESGGHQSGEMRSQVGELTRAVAELREQSSLSDEARRVVNRRRDREVLHKAIEEDIGAGEWDAAMVLVEELAERFGYRADAEEFRSRIEQARYDTVQHKVADSARKVDELLIQRRWDLAMAEAKRIRRLYPDSARAQQLEERVDSARQIYKTDLERRFLQASQAERVDEAMTLLKELDQYLTEQEAEPYREVARGVIGKARENLGARFKLAVQDRRWDEAQGLGSQIIEQFPNSRMAAEVRQLMDTIRGRSKTSVG